MRAQYAVDKHIGHGSHDEYNTAFDKEKHYKFLQAFLIATTSA